MRLKMALLAAVLACVALPAPAQEKVIPPEACTGPDCLTKNVKPADECEGQECQLPPSAEVNQCEGQDCDAIVQGGGDGPKIEKVDPEAAQ